MDSDFNSDDIPFSTPSKASRQPLNRQTPSVADEMKDSAFRNDNFAPPVPNDVLLKFDSLAKEQGGEFTEPEIYRDSVARTMFDTPMSKDNSLTVVTPADNIKMLPTQSLVRVRSTDGINYLGVIVEGPFAEPDGLRGDSPIVVTVTVAGSVFMPRFHGRVQVEIMGEETDDGLVPPRFRPLPNSPVFPLNPEETEKQLQINPLDPKIRLGLVVGFDKLPASIPADKKSVLARHTAVLGTTGGGKTTTVSGMINNLQKSEMATILIDTEGEYTFINEATDVPKMQSLLARRGLPAEGVRNTVIYHLVGKETTNPNHPQCHAFSLPFAKLSPILVAEILGMNEPQEQRYLYAYDQTKRVLAKLKIYPTDDSHSAELLELDEMESGYPMMTIGHIYDITRACAQLVNKQKDSIIFSCPEFSKERERQ